MARGRVSRVGFQMDKGWQKYNNATEVARFKRKFARHRKKAFDILAKEIIREIAENGKFAPNAPLTVYMKSGSTPLHDTNKKLFNSVTSRMDGPHNLFIGIPRSDNFFTKAVAVHEGTAIKVTPAMRQMFMALWLVSMGQQESGSLTGRAEEIWNRKPGNYYPLSESTTVIKIPSRPFIEQAFSSPRTRAMMLKRFTDAVDKTIKELVRR